MTDREVLAAAVRARNDAAERQDRIDWLEDSADAMAHLLTRIGREVPLPEGVREQAIRLVELHEAGVQPADYGDDARIESAAEWLHSWAGDQVGHSWGQCGPARKATMRARARGVLNILRHGNPSNNGYES